MEGGRTRVLGLTGSIGMGKSTAAAMLKRMGLAVFSADACVHALLAPGGAAVGDVARAFPEAVSGGIVSRPRLGAAVFGDDMALARLEAILHPRVRAAEIAFIRAQNQRRARLCVLEIPLLFETGAETLCDAVVVLTAPPFVQATRVLARPGMTADRLAQVRARQMSEAAKAARADYRVATGLGLRHTWAALSSIVKSLSR
jgi:dephospho-CoA kinase